MRSRTVIQSLKLQMKLSDVEFQGDGKKATFFYTADERVDFRELIKRLADEFRIRVEMRQIGMRQEASRVGGIGVCGLELCCSTWLTDFRTVSTGAARYQNLALNPAKLAGQCGKLKCCLNFELDSYMDIMRDFPATNVALETEKGRAVHQKTDIFKRLMWYCYASDRRAGGGFDGPDGGNWVAIPVDRVKEIIALNKDGQKAGDLLEGEWLEVEEVEKEPDYLNVVGQDRIDRMDKKKKKKKRKPGGGKDRPAGEKPQQQGQPQKGQQPQGQGQAQRPQQQGQQQKGPRPQGNKPQGQRPPQGDRPQGNRPQGNRPQGDRPQGNNPQQQAPKEGQQPSSNRPPRQQPPKNQEGT